MNQMVATQPVTLADLIAEAVRLRDEKREFDRLSKERGASYDEVCGEIIALMDEQGVSRTAIQSATVSISEQVMPSVTDWDAFEAYVLDNKALHLLQRRPATTAYRELLDAGVQVPGTEPFTKRALNVRVS